MLSALPPFYISVISSARLACLVHRMSYWHSKEIIDHGDLGQLSKEWGSWVEARPQCHFVKI